MDEKELQAFSQLLDSKLSPFHRKLDQLDIRLSNLERQLNTLSGTTGEIHQDTSRMKEQLDILYGWVDEMELRIKSLEQLT